MFKYIFMYQERTRCVKAMKSQEVELSTLQDLANQFKAELKAANTKNEKLRLSLDEKTIQLRKRASLIVIVYTIIINCCII